MAVVAVTLLVAVACGSAEATTASESDGTPIDFTYETIDGGSARFSGLGDKPVVLNFFASWCPACIAEMPDFESVHLANADRVQFLGLALQDRPESAVALVDDTGITYPVGFDKSGDIFSIFKGLGMPTTVFIDADGVVQDVHTGTLTAEALSDKIDNEFGL